MACCFFGHRDAPGSVRGEIAAAIEKRIGEGEREFFVGNNGAFDRMVQAILHEIAERSGEIEYVVVLSSPSELGGVADGLPTMLPDGIECAPPRFAIDRRNEWMLRHCGCAIVYYRHRFSSCEKWVEKARRRGMHIIEI